MPTPVVNPTSGWLNRKQAAAYLSEHCPIKISDTTLNKKAMSGTGPPFRIWGTERRDTDGNAIKGGAGTMAVYRIEDLDAWIESQFHDPAPPSQLAASAPVNAGSPTSSPRDNREPSNGLLHGHVGGK